MPASPTLTPIFLSHSDGSEIRHIQLVRNAPLSTFWLSNDSSTISTSPSSDNHHSYLRIQAFPNYLLLSVWQDVQVVVSTEGGQEIAIPVSTPQDIKSYILEDGSQFHTTSVRWGVEFDFDHSRSNSMRPPAIPTFEGNTSTNMTVNPADLLLGDKLIVDRNETLVQETDSTQIRSLKEGHEVSQTAEPRASLSQVDNMTIDDHISSSLYHTHEEEATQPLPYAETLAQLREFTNSETEQTSSKQKKHLAEFRPKRKATLELESILESTSIADIEKQSPIPDGVNPNRHFVQSSAADESLTESTTISTTTIQTSEETSGLDSAVADDKISASETETESEPDTHKNTPKHVTIDKPVQKSTQNSQFAPGEESEDVHKEGTNSQDDISDNSKKRRRTVAIATTLAQEETDDPRSPPRKRVKKERQGDTSASEASSRPIFARQKKTRRRVRANLAKEDEEETYPIDSDTVATATDDNSANTRRRTRSASVDRPLQFPATPKVVLSSSVQDTKKYERTLKSLGAIISSDVTEADLFCVSGGEVKKTLKLVLAVIHGKFVVTESWLYECTKTRKLVDPAEHPPDQGSDSSWNLAAAIDRGRSRITTRLLDSWTVYLSEQLAKELGTARVKEQKQIANAMGAKFYSRLPTKNAGPHRLILGSRDDAYAWKVENSGHPMFLREMLTMVALRGRLDMDSDEFRIRPKIKEEGSD